MGFLESKRHVYTPGQNCGLSCHFCGSNDSKESIGTIFPRRSFGRIDSFDGDLELSEVIIPSDFDRVVGRLGLAEGVTFAGIAGDIMTRNPYEIKSLLVSARESIIDPDRDKNAGGFGRLCVITSGLPINLEKLDILKGFGEQVHLVLSLDAGHHNSVMRKESTQTNLDIFSDVHECRYKRIIAEKIVMVHEYNFPFTVNCTLEFGDDADTVQKLLAEFANLKPERINVSYPVQMQPDSNGNVLDAQGRERSSGDNIYITKQRSTGELHVYTNFASQFRRENETLII